MVPLAQLVVALPLSALSLCHPLVPGCQSPLPLPLPHPLPAAVMLSTAAATASALLPPHCCSCTVPRRCAAIAAAPLPSCRYCRCHCRRSAVCWLVVALLSAVQFCHRIPSCNPRRSHCGREHFCMNWYVLIWTTTILAISIATHTQIVQIWIKIKSNSKNNHKSKKINIPLIPRYGGTCAI